MSPKEVNDALRTRYDALNQAILLAEQKLKAMKPPHAVWLGDGTGLGLFKHLNQWRLGYWHGQKGVPIAVPLVEMPLMVRVEAVSGDNLQRLHEAIVAAKEEFVPEVEAAIRKVQEFLGEQP